MPPMPLAGLFSWDDVCVGVSFVLVLGGVVGLLVGLVFYEGMKAICW
jgi:hypothetical protein